MREKTPECEVERRLTRNETFVKMLIPIGILLLITIPYIIILSQPQVINEPSDDCNCFSSGIIINIDDGFYIDIYNDTELIQEGNTSLCVGAVGISLLTFDMDLINFINESENPEEHFNETNFLTYGYPVNIILHNSSEFTERFFFNPEDFYENLELNTTTNLNGKKNTIYLTPAILFFQVAISLIHNGICIDVPYFVLPNFTDFIESNYTNLINCPFSLTECEFMEFIINGLKYDIGEGKFIELYCTVNGIDYIIEISEYL